MVKVKNKRNSNLADQVRNKRKKDGQKKVLNPFEVHINKQKFNVIGKKSKHDRGLPGVSRAKAIQKRKETLGVEMKLLNKTNTFLDRRIGEKDGQLSGEDKILARFAAEKARQHSKKNIFNLADDEILTHRGQTLEDVEKFDDPRSSDEEDEDDRRRGGLNDEFVSEGHFGGGILSRTDAKDGAKTHKDLIEQLIAESKKRKAEKQKLKEQTLDLTEKLDTDWKDLQPIVFKRRKDEDVTKEKEESLIDKLLSKEEKRSEDYDKMMRELRFERRGVPSDGLKSEEQLAKEEREKLEKLERERIARMQGLDVSDIPTSTAKHRSADDLDDNFALDDGPEYMVAYDKDGKLLMPEEVAKDYSIGDGGRGDSGESSGGEDDDEDEDDKDGDNNDEVDNGGDDNDEDGNISDGENDTTKQGVNGHQGTDESESDDSEINNLVIDESELNAQESIDKANSNFSTNSLSKRSKGDSVELSKPADRTISLFDKKSNDFDGDSNENSDVNSDIDENKDMDDFKENNTIDDNETEGSDSDETEGSESDENEGSDKEKDLDNDEGSTAVRPKKDKSEDLSTKTREINSQNGSVLKISETETIRPLTTSTLRIRNEELMDSDSPCRSIEESKIFDGSAIDEKIANMVKAELLARKVIIEKAQKELPYTYEMPDKYEDLEKLLSKKAPDYQSVILERLIKCHHPSLAENNKNLLEKLLAYLLQYVNDLFADLKTEKDLNNSLEVLDRITPHFYDLASFNPMSATKIFQELLKEKYEDFKKNTKSVPEMDMLIFFQLVSMIFSVSDFEHPITTPSLLFMCEILDLCHFRDRVSISKGLFVTALLLEYTALSQRFVPSAVNFIRGILYMAANTSILNKIDVLPPFRQKDSKLLFLDEDCSKMAAGSKMAAEFKMAAEDLVTDGIDDGFKIRAFATATAMLREMFSHMNDLEAQECIFEHHLKLLSMVDVENYPKEICESVQEMVKDMKQILEMKVFRPLSVEKKKPRALKMFEPDVQEHFTGGKITKMSRDRVEREKLKKKVKKEMKGALREIRRDKTYIGAVKIKQKIQSDNVRKEKVKQIYKDASIQQGELNKLQKQKRK